MHLANNRLNKEWEGRLGLLSWLFGGRTSKGNLLTQGWSAKTQHKPNKPLPSGNFGRDRHMPEGKWVRATVAQKVAGVTHRKEAAFEFAQAVWSAEISSASYGIRLEPEPKNAYDRNAIKVYGVAGGREWHIGYVDAETAADISADILSRSLPIAGELYEIWVSDTGFIDIKFLILAPPGNSVSARSKRKRET